MTEQNLIVPVNVEAMCINGSAASKNIFYGSTADFSNLPFFDTDKGKWSEKNYLGEMVNGLDNKTAEIGIHLHWLLPDILKHGIHNEKDNRIKFPKVPDRWLVIRICTNNKDSENPISLNKAWMIESDYVSTTKMNPDAVTIPYELSQERIDTITNNNSLKPSIDDKLFRYLGYSYDISEQKKTNLTSKPFKEVMGQDFTAIGYGEPSFSSYYPNCRNIFGFYDSMSDLSQEDYEIDSDNKSYLKVSYLITGWYSDLNDDPLQNLPIDEANEPEKKISIDEKIKSTLNWVYKTQDTVFPSKCIFSGMIHSIGWHPNKENFYFSEVPSKTFMAVGNTTIEALSALIANQVPTENIDNTEFLLNAVQSGLLNKIGTTPLVRFKIKEQIHQNSFSTNFGGDLWAIRQNDNEKLQNGQEENTEEIIKLSESVAKNLNQLNLYQQNYDKNIFEIESLKHQIYLDWYRYKQTELNSNEDFSVTYKNEKPFLKDLINKKIEKLNLLIAKTGQVVQKKFYTNESNKKLIVEYNTTPESVSDSFANKIIDLLKQINNEISQKDDKFLLNKFPAPKFWHPNDPVVLFSDGIVNPITNRNKKKNIQTKKESLRCRLSSEINTFISDLTTLKIPFGSLQELPFQEDIKKIFTEALLLDPNQANLLRKLSATLPEKSSLQQVPSDFVSEWRTSPWIPIFLNWEVNFYPVENELKTSYIINQSVKKCLESVGITVDIPDTLLDKTFTKEEFEKVLLSMNLFSEQKEQFMNFACNKIFASDTISKNYDLNENLIDFEYIGKYIDSSNSSLNNKNLFYIDTNFFNSNPVNNLLENIKKFLNTNTNEKLSTVLGELNNLPLLSQEFGGFNQNLLMKNQSWQLGILDFSGNQIERNLTKKVKDAIINQKSKKLAPLPYSVFNPVRTGFMKINRLKFIDAFGRVKDINFNDTQIYYSSAFKLPDNRNGNLIYLPPRITQEARLLFRWLASDNEQVEMNSHPATTPVFGWLIPNYLNDNLMIFESSGKLVGIIQIYSNGSKIKWISAPSKDQPFVADEITLEKILPVINKEISNTSLKDFVTEIFRKSQPGKYLNEFMRVIDRTISLVEPLNNDQNDYSAFLLGHPLALTKASLKIDLKGLPAKSQAWGNTIMESNSEISDTDGFTSISFPIRLGDLKQINDGLIGFFLEDDTRPDFRTLYAAGAVEGSEGIKKPLEDTINLDCSPDSPAVKVFMIIDPRAKVHATTGILPIKDIDIPQDIFVEALKNINLSFFVSPIISDEDKINIFIPEDKEFFWSWSEVKNNKWSDSMNIEKLNGPQNFSLKQQKIKEGWLNLKKQ